MMVGATFSAFSLESKFSYGGLNYIGVVLHELFVLRSSSTSKLQFYESCFHEVKSVFFLVMIKSYGTIHLRRRQIFTIFDPYTLPSTFQQNAYEGDF